MAYKIESQIYLTENAAVEYGKLGIRVNAVGPGFIRTQMIAAIESNPQAREQLISMFAGIFLGFDRRDGFSSHEAFFRARERI